LYGKYFGTQVVLRVQYGLTRPMHTNCYAAFVRNWLGLRRRVGIESGLAGPQSCDGRR
jgi:hypothetical protein